MPNGVGDSPHTPQVKMSQAPPRSSQSSQSGSGSQPVHMQPAPPSSSSLPIRPVPVYHFSFASMQSGPPMMSPPMMPPTMHPSQMSQPALMPPMMHPSQMSHSASFSPQPPSHYVPNPSSGVTITSGSQPNGSSMMAPPPPMFYPSPLSMPQPYSMPSHPPPPPPLTSQDLDAARLLTELSTSYRPIRSSHSQRRGGHLKQRIAHQKALVSESKERGIHVRSKGHGINFRVQVSPVIAQARSYKTDQQAQQLRHMSTVIKNFMESLNYAPREVQTAALDGGGFATATNIDSHNKALEQMLLKNPKLTLEAMAHSLLQTSRDDRTLRHATKLLKSLGKMGDVQFRVPRQRHGYDQHAEIRLEIYDPVQSAGTKRPCVFCSLHFRHTNRAHVVSSHSGSGWPSKASMMPHGISSVSQREPIMDLLSELDHTYTDPHGDDGFNTDSTSEASSRPGSPDTEVEQEMIRLQQFAKPKKKRKPK